MKILDGDIWKLKTKNDIIVIPTNTKVDSRGEAVMGRGLALQAAQKIPLLRFTYGSHLTGGVFTSFPMYYREFSVVCFPTKIDWKHDSELNLIINNMFWLNGFAYSRAHENKTFLLRMNAERILVPMLGCGEGHLNEALIIGLMKDILLAPKIRVVRYK